MRARMHTHAHACTRTNARARSEKYPQAAFFKCVGDASPEGTQ